MHPLLPSHPEISVAPPCHVTRDDADRPVVTVDLAPADAVALAASGLPTVQLAQAAQHTLGRASYGTQIHDDDAGITVITVAPAVRLRGRAALWCAACATPDALRALLDAALSQLVAGA